MRLPVFISVLLCLLVYKAKAQCPSNIGFENGNFSNWECSYGTIDRAGEVFVTPMAPRKDTHILYDKTVTSLDPYGNFPVVCPNGSNYSIRVGNDKGGGQAARVTYTYNIPTGQAFTLILNYAIVLQNPTHLDWQQPKFMAQIFNITDNKYIDCPSFNFKASSTLPGFKPSPVNSKNVSVYYKDWAATTINLGAYGGKTVRLEFTVSDCAPGAHFGYAYLDIDQNCGSAITGNAYCNGQNMVSLHGPGGFANYTWFDSNMSKVVGQGQVLNISPPPPDQTSYVLRIEPYDGVGCVDTLYTTVHKINGGYKLNVIDTIYGCKGSTADITASYITAGSSDNMSYSYYTDPETLTYLYKPEAISTDGLYYIKGVNADGCIGVKPIQVTFADAQLVIKDPQSVTYPATVDISTTFMPRSGYVYSYYSDAAGKDAIDNYTSIKQAGTYYIKAVSSLGCEIIKPVHVEVLPPPPYELKAPNTFSPNGDGVNDYFAISLKGEIIFDDLKIFNRSGQIVYTTNKPGDRWNGNYNNSPLPAGVYYWVFNGTDGYYKTISHRSGYIMLLR